MKLDTKLTGAPSAGYDATDEDAALWEIAKQAGKQILYITMILAAGVFVVLSIMVSIFTMPFREGFKQ
jgi:hypothetical protein